MLRNRQDHEKDALLQHRQPHPRCLQPNDLKRSRAGSKENIDHLQLNPHIASQRSKLESEALAASQSFAAYSRVHLACLDKHHTLFLAFHLHQWTSRQPALKPIPPSYRSLCCLFLAMKYEETYPPTLVQLAKLMKLPYCKSDYRRHEAAILAADDVDLDVLTPDRLLEAYFEELRYDKVEEMKAYYLLELAFLSPNIHSRFAENKVLQAIIQLVRPQHSEQQDETVTQIMRLLLEARVGSGLERQLYRKYLYEKYKSVSALALQAKAQ